MSKDNEVDGGSGSVRWSRDPGGIVTVILDDPAARTNMITGAHVAGMAALLDYLESHLDDVTGSS